jgi:phytoene synthase
MITQPSSTWEHRLLALAHEALDSGPSVEPVAAGSDLLEQAYRRCAEITREYSKTFYLASGLLPKEKRRGVRALYAFCRVSDDLVDRPEGDAHTGLAAWRKSSLAAHPDPDDPVALAWADARHNFCIPRRYAEQLIDGIASDIHHRRYASFEDLAAYCYGVASTVGLMAMHIVGFSGPQAVPYAVKLGIALQLTNILRDVGEDWRGGRLYLPLEELDQFGLSEADIASGSTGARWQAFLAFQMERNRRLYAEALPGIAHLDADGRFAIAAAAGLYRAILDDIQTHGGDVFTRRAHIGALGKARRLPGIWWGSRSV